MSGRRQAIGVGTFPRPSRPHKPTRDKDASTDTWVDAIVQSPVTRDVLASVSNSPKQMDPRNQVTLLWQLVHPTQPTTMECVAMRRNDNRVELLIERGRVQEAFGVFEDTTTAVRTAFRFEAEMLRRGWRKIV